MADSQDSSRLFTMPIALVGVLAAGALLPHLSSPARNPSPTAVDAPAPSNPSLAGISSDSQQVTTALDLLADYFGVDISTAGLRRVARESARVMASPAEDGLATGPAGDRRQAAGFLRAFFCMGIRSKPEGALRAVWPLASEIPAPPPDCDQPTGPGASAEIAPLTAFITRYFNDDARRDDVAVTTLAAQLRPIDELRLLAKDFDAVNKDPLAWAVVDAAAARHGTSLQFLIATVPDPIDSYETWQFDPYVDAIRQGIEASGYLLDRFYLPDAEVERKSGGAVAAGRRDLHMHAPGVIVFRWKNAGIPSPTANQEPLLVLFLVPETPVAGIHQEPFIRAVDFASGWMSRHPAQASGGLRILGPSFSGSTPSLVRALVNVDDLLVRRLGHTTVTIVSGSASNNSNREAFESAHLSHTVRFRATMHSNAAIAKGADLFLRDAGVDGRMAYLSEASTAYGSDTQNSDARITIKFPFNIAQLRSDENRDGEQRRDPAASLIPGFRPLSLEDVTTPTDQFPLQTPRTTSSSVELVLANLIDAIRREHVRIVSIDATDVRDKLFLVQEIRVRAPDVMLVTTDTDLFQVHPDQARWLKGLVVISTYPLHASSQNLVYPFRGTGAASRPNGDLGQFSSVNVEGLYNAVIAQLNYEIDGSPQARFGGRDEYTRTALLPRLLDYGGPGCPVGEPGVWVSVVGEGQVVPLRVYCGLEDQQLHLSDQQRYVFRPVVSMAGDPPASTHEVSVPMLALLLILLLGVGAGAACVAAWRTRTSASPVMDAYALALCGPMIPATFLGVALPALAWQQSRAGEYPEALVTAVATAGSICAVVFGLWVQRRSRGFVVVRSLFVLASALVASYAVHHLRESPQIFLQRTLDLGTMVSPLPAILAFGAVPVLLAAAELRRLRALGATTRSTQGIEQWEASLDSVAGQAANGLHGIRTALVRSYQSLFFLPRRWMLVPIALTATSAVVIFGAHLHPVLSIEGSVFGLGVVLLILVLQFTYGVAITQFLYLSCASAQFLSRLGNHPEELPYVDVPAALLPSGVIPKAPRLTDLRYVADVVPGGHEALHADLEMGHKRRWFQSSTWDVVRKELSAAAPRPPGAAGDDAGEYARQRKLTATSVVFVVRELFSRLGVSLCLIGPALALLMMLYVTVQFDQSHSLLGMVWTDVLVAIVVVMTVFIWMDRDAVVSKIRCTTPGQIDWNWAFASKILVYVLLPLVTLFATQFPEIGSGLMRILEPAQRLP